MLFVSLVNSIQYLVFGASGSGAASVKSKIEGVFVSALSLKVPSVFRSEPGAVELSLSRETVDLAVEDPPSPEASSIFTSTRARFAAPVENEWPRGWNVATESVLAVGAARLSYRTTP